MSLANVSKGISRWAARVKLAEDQQRDFEELLAQWFCDSNPGARDFLREIAMDHRERHPVRPAIPHSQRQEDERHQRTV